MPIFKKRPEGPHVKDAMAVQRIQFLLLGLIAFVLLGEIVIDHLLGLPVKEDMVQYAIVNVFCFFYVLIPNWLWGLRIDKEV